MSDANNSNQSYGHQDWTPCVLRKTVKKIQPKHVDPTVIKMAKLDQADDIQLVKKVSEDIRKTIIALRVEKKISQEDLAKGLNLDKSVIREIEAGKYNENKTLTNRIKNHLKSRPTPALVPTTTAN
jgi:ribosome-binding protein aMBF1 (putative translation factor)